MAYKCREEIVGKRFLSVRSPTKLKVSKISEWEWRSGVVRAVSSRDTASLDFTALVEFEDVEWQKREWTRVHEAYQEFLVEHTLVWTSRPTTDRESMPSPPLPALCFKPIVDKLGLGATKKRVVEFLVDRDLAFVEEEDIRFYQEGDENRYDAGSAEAQKAVKAWVDYQDGQKILLTTPTVLVGYRVKVYRAEGTTQWYTAVIQSYNHTTKSLTITDDTVLEEHNEDPALIQMRLIDNGVVDSILRGVEVGIAPRRRPRTSQVGKEQSHQSTFGRRQSQQFSPAAGSQASKQVTPTARPASKARQNVPRSSVGQELNNSQERGGSRGKCQASEKRKRKSEGSQAEEPAPRSASPNKRVKSGESDTEARAQADSHSHGRVSACLERDAAGSSSGGGGTEPYTSAASAGARAGTGAPRDKSSRSHKQKGGSGGGVCKGVERAARDKLADSSEVSVASAASISGSTTTSLLDSVLRADKTATSTSVVAAFSPTVVLSSLPPASAQAGRKDSKQNSRRKAPLSRKAAEEEVSDKSKAAAPEATKHGVVGPDDLLAAYRNNPVTCHDGAAAQLVSCHSETERQDSDEQQQTLVLCLQQQQQQPEDTMHLKKQQALLAGRNHHNSSSPSSSTASQTSASAPTALSAGIDVTRSLTDQLTKLAKADKLALGGDSRTDTDTSTSSTEAALTPVITTTASHAADKTESSAKVQQQQDFFGDRHREASAFTCVQSAASRATSIGNNNNSSSSCFGPASDDRAESRASDGQLAVEERRGGGSVKSSPASSPLIVDRSEPVSPYRDPVLMSKNPVRSTFGTCGSSGGGSSLHKTTPYAAAPPPHTAGLTSTSPALTSHPGSLPRSLVPAGLSYAPHQLPPSVLPHGLPLTHGFSQLDALAARGLAAAAAQQQQQQMAALQYQNSAAAAAAAAAHLMQTLPYSTLPGGGRLPQLDVLQKFPPQAPVPAWLSDALLQREQLERKLEQERMEREHLERLELERLERERLERAERERRERKEKMERERLEREKAEKEKAERLEREKAERDRLEKERQERERLSLEQREWEQRQERERILREAADTSAAVDQHFTASLSRLANQRGMAQGMWPPTPSISKGTGKGLMAKSDMASLPQGDKLSDHLDEERLKRDVDREHDRLVLGDDKRHLQSILEQRGDQKSEGVVNKDNKPIYGYPPYHYNSSGYPLFAAASSPSTSSASSKPEAISFSLYGYPSQYSTMTTEQLQKKGLAPGSGRPLKEEKGIYPSPAHTSNPSPPQPRHVMPPHHRDVKPQSSVIVENKPVVKIENPVTAHSHHHNSSPLSSSSSPRPRPAHMPEQRSDHSLPAAGSTNSSMSQHVMASTSSSSIPHSSHATAFSSMDAKSMSRAQSPYSKGGGQLGPGTVQPPPPAQRQQSSVLSQNQQQPINYCKSSSSGKIRSPNVPSPSGACLQPAIAQPSASLPASSIAYSRSLSLIQQGLVPNPMYSQGSVSVSVPLGRSQSTATATTTITSTTTTMSSSVTSAHNPYLPTVPPSAPQQPGKHSQHSPSGGGSKRKAGGSGRDNGTIQKRSKAAESDVNKRRTPNTGMVSVPVTTPQILTNPSPYTTSSALGGLRPGNPSSATPDGFLDSFRSFVETTVHKAFLQDQELELEKEEHERLQKQQQQEKQQQPGQGGLEKVEQPVVVKDEMSRSSPLVSVMPQTSVTMDTIRVANGQVDTDSDTLSAPSPPPSQARMDASPHGRGGAAIATKVKKAWLQRHSGEDKKSSVLQAAPSPLTLAQEDSNSSQSASREVNCFLKDAVTSVFDSSTSSANGEGVASPASSLILPNGSITDLKHTNDESTSSASETESQSPPIAKKRAKSKKASCSKKVKTEERASLSPSHAECHNPAPNNVRKKNPSKRSKTDSKENPKPKEKQDVHDPSSTLPSQLLVARPSPSVLAQSSASSSPVPVSLNKKHEERAMKGVLPSKHPCDDSPQPSSQDSEKESDSGGRDKKKTRRSRDNFRNSPTRNGSSFNKPLVKDSVATLKRTGTPFIQDGPCSEVTPKLSKCRECKMTPTQRSKKIPNIFCRFYAFRRLKYSAKGSVTIAGFSELSDADPDDIEPWLPRYPTEDPQLDEENAKFIIAKVGDKFCELVEQEKEAKSWAGDDAKIAWKRAVTGVREMCDVCDTTLFNMHWVCHKCGFVVCLDCYKSKMKSKAEGKSEDSCKWLTCSSNRQAHEAEKLMLTQIIPSDALWELGRLIHDIRRKWSILAKCPCGQNTMDSKIASKNGINQQLVKKMMNGIGEEPGRKGKKSVPLPHSDEKLVEQDEFNQDSLALLANVAALRGGDKPEKRSSKVEKMAEEELGEDGDRKSSGSCSTLRELLTKTAGKGKVPNEKKTRPKTSGSSLDNIIQSVVEKSCRDLDTGSQPFKFLHYIPRLGQWNRELPIIAHSLTETSVLYPDVPHSWLCDGRLLRLHDPRHKGNLKIFQEQWKRGQPVLVSCVNKLNNLELWRPETFSSEFGHLENDLVNCRNGNVIVGNPMKDFWDGFESIENRLLDEDGSPMLLKLKDWPPADDFSDMLPSRFQDLMQALPLPEYTGRNGKLNLASRLPDFLVRPDLGPKMYNAYGSAKYPKEGTTNLHLDISDAVNVLVYVGVPSDGPRGRKEHEEAAVKAIDEAGCDNITKRRVREVHEIPGALWQIYDAHDADKIRDFLNKVAKERGETIEPDHDSIHDQSWYLDEELRDRLLKEYGVQGYTIVQCLGDAIFIPAGAPHQVRNLHSCIKVAEDFVSPEHLNHCFRLTQEFRQLSDTHSNHEDKLQVKNIIYHAVKDSIAVLRELEPEEKK